MLTKAISIDKIEILASGHIQVRRVTQILEDGKPIGNPEYHRASYAPGDDIPDLPADVRAVIDPKALATNVWTEDVVQAHKAREAATK